MSTSLDFSECNDCGFTLVEGYRSLVCPTCLRPWKTKNKKMLFILKD